MRRGCNLSKEAISRLYNKTRPLRAFILPGEWVMGLGAILDRWFVMLTRRSGSVWVLIGGGPWSWPRHCAIAAAPYRAVLIGSLTIMWRPAIQPG